MRIIVYICENDNQGDRSGHCSMIEFAKADDNEKFLRLCAKSMFDTGEPIDTFGKQIWMYDCGFDINSYIDWYGNTMWNAYNLSAGQALGLINLIRRKRTFDIDESLLAICDKWAKDEEVEAVDIGIDDPYLRSQIFYTKQASSNEGTQKTFKA